VSINLVRDYDSRMRVARWLREIPTWQWLACDVETTGLDPWNDKLKLVTFGTETDAWAFRYPEDADAIENAFKLERELVGWNGKFDEQFLINAGFEPRFENDALLMAHLAYSGEDLHLKSFADRHLGADSSKAQRELREMYKRTKTNWATVPNDTYEYWFYGAKDSQLTAQAAAYLYPQIVARGYDDLYEIELEVVKAVAEAERRGMKVDLDYCQEQLALLTKQADEIKGRYPAGLLGGRKKLAERLEADGVKLKLGPPGKKTGRRQPVLDDEALRAYGHPIADDVLEYRGLLKNANTYFKAYLDHEVDGRVHTSLATMRARTGRMSSSQPNLQNVPKREAGDYVRRAFVADPGHTFVFADYHQIEYRIFACDAQEPDLIQAFLDGKDMHAVTAEMVLGHEPTQKERDTAKGTNFTELFGGGDEQLAKTADITVAAAQRFKKAYHAKFPRVKKYMRAVVRFTERNGMAIDTFFGRRVGVDHEKPYAAVNYRIQGTAADVLKRAIVRLRATRWGQYLVLLVHDEFVLCVPDELVPACVAELPDILEDRDLLPVPLTVEVSTSKRWGEGG
jgi:DNA polymerase I